MKNLTYDGRKIIEKLLKKGLGIRAIGRCLDREYSTISEEIKKNIST